MGQESECPTCEALGVSLFECTQCGELVCKCCVTDHACPEQTGTDSIVSARGWLYAVMPYARKANGQPYLPNEQGVNEFIQDVMDSLLDDWLKKKGEAQ